MQATTLELNFRSDGLAAFFNITFDQLTLLGTRENCYLPATVIMMQSDISTASDLAASFLDEQKKFKRSPSEESSFYGPEAVKATYMKQLSEFENEDYWRVHDWNVQVIVARKNKPSSNKRKRQDSISQVDEPDSKKSKKSMECCIAIIPGQEGKEPFNPYEGLPTALQMGESVDSFLRRLQPSTLAASEPWIWCANFGSSYRDTDCRLAEFKQTGTRLLDQFVEKRKSLEGSFNPPRHPGAITPKLQPDGEQLQKDILKAAKDCGITTGKWMLFAPPSRIDACWADVVRATVDGRLGISAKVSTKPGGGSESTHVICVYAKDFDDQADLKRILKELVRLRLAAAVTGPLLKGDGNAQKQIYFKANAYTWLDIMGGNEYKLKPSIYSTASLLTKADLAELK